MTPGEKNCAGAFERALSSGFGIETDLRDCNGVLVVSHDMPKTTADKNSQMLFDTFLELYCSYPTRPTLALNIKADGLSEPIQAAIDRFGIDNYFVFDMSVPDTLSYLKAGMTTFTRRSEFETGSSLDLRSHGLWLDAFEAPYVTAATIKAGLATGRPVAIVSPELHKKPHLEAWRIWLDICHNLSDEEKGRIMLCTDFPGEADFYFRW